MDSVLELAGLLGPAIAGLLTVPLTRGLTNFVGILDRAPPTAKQLIAVLVAFGLTKLGTFLQVALPESLELFTGDSVEALIAASIAFGVHAGQKARSTAPKLLTLLALFSMPVAAACQTGAATVTVVDRSRLIVQVAPPSFTGELGDTITFQAIALDTITGDTISGLLRWSSADTTGVSIDPQTGHATLLRAGTYQVFADLVDLVGIIITRENDDGTFSPVFQDGRREIYAATGIVPDSLKLVQGETVHLCAYLEDSAGDHYRCTDCEWRSSDPTVATVTNGGDDTCPLWAPGMPFPEPALPQSFQLEQLRRLGVQVGDAFP